MGQIIFSRSNFYITQDTIRRNKHYYTVVKDIGLGKENPHSHLNNFKAAKLVLHFARKEQIPNKYSGYLKESIRRLLKSTNEILQEKSRRCSNDQIRNTRHTKSRPTRAR